MSYVYVTRGTKIENTKLDSTDLNYKEWNGQEYAKKL